MREELYPADRLWARVEKTPTCWLWQGYKLRSGYGRVMYLGRNYTTHRLSWALTNGPIPDGLWVLHKCDNPPCVRPDHLFLGTRQDNVDDMVAKRRHVAIAPDFKRNAKVTREQVVAIRQEYAAGGVRYDDIAARHGMTRGAVGHIISGRSWPNVGGPLVHRPPGSHERRGA